MAALILIPSTLLEGDTPTPDGLAPLVSSVVPNPSDKQAAWNAFWMSDQVPD